MALTEADFKALEDKGYVRKNTSQKILTKSGVQAADERWNKIPAEDRALFCLRLLDADPELREH